MVPNRDCYQSIFFEKGESISLGIRNNELKGAISFVSWNSPSVNRDSEHIPRRLSKRSGDPAIGISGSERSRDAVHRCGEVSASGLESDCILTVRIPQF